MSRIALVVLVGLLLTNVFAYAPYAAAQQEAMPGNTKQLIADEQKALDAAIKRYQQMQADMKSMMNMPMTATEKSMAHQMDEMAQMIQMLLDQNKKLLDIIKSMPGGQH